MVKSSSSKYLFILALGVSLLVGCQTLENTDPQGDKTQTSTPAQTQEPAKSKDVGQALDDQYKQYKNVSTAINDFNQELTGKARPEEIGAKSSKVSENIDGLYKLINKKSFASQLPKEAKKTISDINTLIGNIKTVIDPIQKEKGWNIQAIEKIQKNLKIRPPDGVPGDSSKKKISGFLNDNQNELGNKIKELESYLQTPPTRETHIPTPNPTKKSDDSPPENYAGLSIIAILFSILSTLASMYAVYSARKGNPATGQSEQNGVSQSSGNQSTSSQSSHDNFVTRRELEQKLETLAQQLTQQRTELYRLQAQAQAQAQVSQYELNLSDPSPHPRIVSDNTRSVTSFPPGSLKDEELPYTQIVEAYNSDPAFFSNDAIEVSTTEDSITQRRLGVNQAVVLEKVVKGRGSFWVLPGNYLVPKMGIKINTYKYETVEAIFLCRNYQSGATSFRLCKPGKVSPLSQGETWQLLEEGELQF